MDEIVRHVFAEDVPAWDRLEGSLREWLADPSWDLEDIREEVWQHICDQLEEHTPKDGDLSDGAVADAMNLAFSVVDGLIEKLPVDPVNCRRLLEYVKGYHSWNAYDRLVSDYIEIVPSEAARSLISSGKRYFMPEATSHWLRLAEGSEAHVLLKAIVTSYGDTLQGSRVVVLGSVWKTIAKLLENDWANAFKLSPRQWEEVIAGAFDMEGFDDVILTPRSGDHGRDVIATRRGICSIRVIGSVKAFRPDRTVPYDDVRALLGVLHGDQNATKGIVTTTSSFPPNIEKDPYIAPFMSHRLELLDGRKLHQWLCDLVRQA